MVASDKLGTEGERAGRQELRKGVVSTKSGRALWSYSWPNNGLGRSPYLNKIFGVGLGSPLPGKGAKKVLCTLFTLMELFLVMENGKHDLDRKGLV